MPMVRASPTPLSIIPLIVILLGFFIFLGLFTIPESFNFFDLTNQTYGLLLMAIGVTLALFIK
jgi:ribose/xylose/arabinose/galactoside ABC-type transport system permease subunit